MSKLRNFDKLDSSKKQSNKSSWVILSVSVLVVTIIIFSSYAKYLSTSKEVAIANSTAGDFYYTEPLLNGTDPLLTDNLIPVTISDTGSVAKADLYNEWYKYEDKKWANSVKLFEKEVTSIKDSSGKGNDGTVYGNLEEGYGYAPFDGVDDYIDTGVGSGLEYGNSYAVAIKFVYNYDSTIYRRRMLNGGGVIDVYLQNDGKFVSSFGYINSSGSLSYGGVSLDNNYFEENKVYNILTVYDGTTLSLYDDGNLVASAAISKDVASFNTNFCLGAACGDEITNFYDNNLYYVSLSSDALTEEEIYEYYKNGELSNKEDLLFEYKFYDVYEEDMTDIAEDDIESYFVWIPKYSYQLWDLGEYSSITSLDITKRHAIGIRFGTTNTSDSVIGECATPGVASSSGNCVVGNYMTHPAFLAFDTTGFWVGKFETGYEGAATTEEAQANVVDANKLLIKPNVYSWRGNTISNMFKTSYEYDRSNDSHMMKNTEWGAVAYLSHSIYGIQSSVRLNNNSAYITGYSALEEPTKLSPTDSVDGDRYESTSLGVDGDYTLNYFNSNSVLSSTTGNYSGVYDLSGGNFESVMAYTSTTNEKYELSGLTALYSDFFTNADWKKYYDEYTSVNRFDYNNRILGDATGEVGPFYENNETTNGEYRSSWYDDFLYYPVSGRPWFVRGGYWQDGIVAGVYYLYSLTGEKNDVAGFRIVLAPTN